MKMRCFILVALALCLAVPPRAGRAAEVPACDAAAPHEKALFASVDERLEIILADGRRVYFPTLEPPRATAIEPERPKHVAEELTSLLEGKSLDLIALGVRDRWGRIPARLFVEGEAESVEEILAVSGLVMASGASANGESGACRKALLAAEAAARGDRLGIWADPEFAVISPGDGANLAARAGIVTLVEGRIASIGHTAPRLYLNFGAGSGGFSLTIARRLLPLFDRAGLAEKNLLHQSIRVRGVVEIGAAPQIELFHPDQIEFMEDRR
ncbi:thermonuclease family protein [uncultured Rhodoblastus sp.]|uniref:thermonuclease family protein n=1 Tax=uncultured Rhodoblastus sp. TaxID=543037 RepID=UPI0025ECCA8F|nr:thermonuclease family protein [uncultured Rhodoblastus sp.]